MFATAQHKRQRAHFAAQLRPGDIGRTTLPGRERADTPAKNFNLNTGLMGRNTLAIRINKLPAILRCSVALGAVLLPVSAFAQTAAAEDDDADQIVVTGTLIRGVEVTGAEAITVTRGDIIESGASTTMELLGSLPQITNTFNNRVDTDPRQADRAQVSRPNLRNLPGVTSATGSTTLLLVDGHRMTPMGVDQASFDPDFIPPGALERVEVVTDGGSSLYGADAVGGVINFITRRNFEGIEVNGGYDVGDNYNAWSAGATAGLNWSGGGAFISYNYYHRDDLLNSDRDYAARGNWNANGTVLSPSGTNCIAPVGSVTKWVYIPSFGVWTDNSRAGSTVTNVGSPCDIDGESSLLPELDRHTAMLSLTHEISDSLTFGLKANYGESAVNYSRYATGSAFSGPTPTTSLTPTASQITVPGAPGATYNVSAVGLSYGANSAYVHRNQELDLQVYGVTPELTADLGSDWQLKTTGYWGQSDSSRRLPSADQLKLNAYVRSGALVPTNVAAASAAVINDITNYEVAGDATQSLLLARAVLDGPLVELPGGEMRLAVGVEYNRDHAALRSGSYTIGGIDSAAYRTATRNVKSVFGELSIPVFSMVDLSLAGRLDDYSDFGSTFNPSVGVSFQPFEQLRLYGHWNESYNAPTALDSVRTANGRFIANASAGVPDPLGERTSNPTRNDVLLLEGSGGALKPQTAETWAGGLEFSPTQNLTFGASYYDIDFRNLLSSVNPQLASVVLLNPEKFNSFPTQAEYDAALLLIENGSQFASVNANDVGVIIDRRVANLDAARLKGIDFFVRYQLDTSFGTVSGGISGNRQFSFDITSNGTTVDQLANDSSDTTISGNIGLRTGGFSARVTVNHTNGFDTNIAVAQTYVGGFTVADLALGYEFEEGAGAFGGLSLRVNVDNLFDTDPPVYRQQRNLNYSGFTLGRIFKFAISKKF